MTVTTTQANKVLAEVRRVCKPWLTDNGTPPKIIKDFEWNAGTAPYAVVWEEGPYDWTILVTGGGRDPEFGFEIEQVEVDGVFVEPYTGWALGIYEDGG